MKRNIGLAVALAMALAVLFISFVAAQDGGEPISPHASDAGSAEAGPPDSQSGPQALNSFDHPLFVGVDDLTVPAYIIDPTTDDVITAFVGVEVRGAAYDPLNDWVYFSDAADLYIWPVGGSPLFMGTVSDTTATNVSMEGLAFFNGTLYASKVGSSGEGEGIYAVDTTTFQATRVISYTDDTLTTIGGIDIDPVTGQMYGVNDDNDLLGLVQIDPGGTVTLVAPYPAGETDIDGLAVGGNKAYLIADDNTPNYFNVFDFGVMTYTGVVTNPWTSTEVFAGGAWIEQPTECVIGGWQSVSPVNTGRSRPALAYFPPNGNFYLLGGESTGGNFNNPIEEYNPLTDVWTDTVNLLTGVSNIGAAAVGNYIYVPGGYNGLAVADMQRYDPQAGVVVTMTPMITGTFAHGVTALNGKIHVLGGSNAGGPGSNHQIYDVAGDSWSTGAPLPTPVHYPAAVSDGQYVYVIGGNTTNDPIVQRYNPVGNSWDTIADLDTGRGGPGAFFDGSNLWVVGGGWGSYLTTTEYWTGEGAWHTGPAMNVGVRTVGAAFGDGLALKAAGWNGGYETAAETLRISCSPDIAVDPASLASTHSSPPQVVVQTLTISNTGVGDLNWSLFEETTQLILDDGPAGSFERGAHPPSAGAAPGEAPGGKAPAAINIPLGTAAYGWNSLNGPYYTIFNLDTPETLLNVTDFIGSGNFIGAGEYHNDKVYMLDFSNNMWEVDPDTGAILNAYMATAPPGSEAYSGLTVDPTTGQAYAVSTNVATSTLLTIDLPSGVATPVGPVTNGPAIIALAADGAGDLYGYDILSDMLLGIDKSSGSGTVIGSIGFDANFGQGMAYDPATDTIYMAAFNNGTFRPELRAVNTATGNTTFLGVLGESTPGGLNQIAWLGIGQPCLANNLPWLSVSPAAGTAPEGGTSNVSVTFNSQGLGTGTYTGNLCIDSNDPDEAQLRVPVTLDVGDYHLYLPLVIRNGSPALKPEPSTERLGWLPLAGGLFLIVPLWRRRR